MESAIELLAGFKFLTTGIDALVVVDIVLPAAIVQISHLSNLPPCIHKQYNSDNVLLGLVGVGEAARLTR